MLWNRMEKSLRLEPRLQFFRKTIIVFAFEVAFHFNWPVFVFMSKTVNFKMMNSVFTCGGYFKDIV